MTGRVVSLLLACGCEVRALPRGPRHNLALAHSCAMHRQFTALLREPLARHGRGVIVQLVPVAPAVAAQLGHAVSAR